MCGASTCFDTWPSSGCARLLFRVHRRAVGDQGRERRSGPRRVGAVLPGAERRLRRPHPQDYFDQHARLGDPRDRGT